MMISMLKRRLRRFGRDTDGYVTVEAMIVLPVLLWLFGVGWVYFDAMRQQSINQKTNYAIGDVLSRQTDAISESYVDGVHNLLNTLNKSNDTETGLRVSVIEWDERRRLWVVNWSQTRGVSAPPLAQNSTLTGAGDLRGGEADRLPTAADRDQLILVETWDTYDPVFEVGLRNFDITTYSFTRPRFTPQLVFDEGA